MSSPPFRDPYCNPYYSDPNRQYFCNTGQGENAIHNLCHYGISPSSDLYGKPQECVAKLTAACPRFTWGDVETLQCFQNKLLYDGKFYAESKGAKDFNSLPVEAKKDYASYQAAACDFATYRQREFQQNGPQFKYNEPAKFCQSQLDCALFSKFGLFDCTPDTNGARKRPY